MNYFKSVQRKMIIKQCCTTKLDANIRRYEMEHKIDGIVLKQNNELVLWNIKSFCGQNEKELIELSRNETVITERIITKKSENSSEKLLKMSVKNTIQETIITVCKDRSIIGFGSTYNVKMILAVAIVIIDNEHTRYQVQR